MRKLSEKLKILRTEKRLSIEMLSKQVGIGVASISRWENNQSDIKGDQLIILATFFGVTADYILGLED